MGLEKLTEEIEKTRAKALKYQERLKELEQRKAEQENLSIVQQVRGATLSPEELAQAIRAFRRNNTRDVEGLFENRID